jgi:hypothetical protein
MPDGQAARAHEPVPVAPETRPVPPHRLWSSAVAGYLRDCATADARSLRLVRVILGLAGTWVFFDAYRHAYFVVEHPWSVPKPVQDLSLFGISNSVVVARALAVAFMAASTLWAVGIRETLTASIALAGMTSVNSGMGVMTTGGNSVWCLSVLWYLLIKDRRGPLVTDLAVLGMRLQLAVIYMSSWLLKQGDGYWATSDAVAVNLRAFLWETSLGRWVGWSAPSWLLPKLSDGTLAVELLLPVLFFFPLWRRTCANIGFVVLVLFHVGTGALMHLGSFPAAMIGMGMLVVRPWWPAPAAAIAPPARSGVRRAKTALAAFYLLLVGTECWNEGIARHRPPLWIAWPGRTVAESTVGLVESWGMFVLGSPTHPPEPIPITNSIVLLRDEQGTLLSPVNGELFDWGHEFVTGQNRGSSLRKLMFARWKTPGGDGGLAQAERRRLEDAWFLDLAGWYASRAGRPIREVYFYRVQTSFFLRAPVFPTEASVTHEATVTLAGGEPYDLFRFNNPPWKIALAR